MNNCEADKTGGTGIAAPALEVRFRNVMDLPQSFRPSRGGGIHGDYRGLEMAVTKPIDSVSRARGE